MLRRDDLVRLAREPSRRDVVVARRCDQRAFAQSDDARVVRPAPRRFVGRFAEDRFGPLVVAEQRVRRALEQQGRRPPETVGRERRHRRLGVQTHLLDAVAASRRVEQRDQRPHRAGVAAAPLGRLEPSVGVAGATVQSVDAAAEHGDLRETLELLHVVELAQPALHRRDPPAVVRGQRDAAQDPRRPHAVTRSTRVLERGLEVAASLVPVGGTAVQDRNQLRLVFDELAPEQFPEQVVIAVPLAATVERHEQQVPAFDLLELARRPTLVENGIAK